MHTLSYLSVTEGPLNHSIRTCQYEQYINLVSSKTTLSLALLTLCSPSSSVMLRPTVLSLLLACAVSLGSCTVILENGMPLMWAQTWGQVTDLPTQNGILNPDPWNVLHRMSLYRLMISATDSYMGCMGTNATDNPIWGLPLQLGWMKTSGKVKLLKAKICI